MPHVSYEDLASIVHYVYTGDVSIPPHRLDSFLSYLSEKIKANTLKISACDKPDTASDQYSGTTASHSDLSIDDVNLNRFKEYMLNSDRKVHGHSVRQTQA